MLVSLRLQSLMVLLALVTAIRGNLRPCALEVLCPRVNLCGMHPKVTDELVDGFVPFEGFERHPSFAFCAVVVPLCRHIVAPLDLHFRHGILSSFHVQFPGYIIISPLLLNGALHGMEQALGIASTSKGLLRRTYAVVRYADDCAVFCPTQEKAIEAHHFLATWLGTRGLKWSDEKTHMRHLREGFNCLGFNIRHYPTPNSSRRGYKLRIETVRQAARAAVSRGGRCVRISHRRHEVGIPGSYRRHNACSNTVSGSMICATRKSGEPIRRRREVNAMMTREEALRRLEAIAHEVVALRDALAKEWAEAPVTDPTHAFLAKCQGWEDTRSPEEIVAEIEDVSNLLIPYQTATPNS